MAGAVLLVTIILASGCTTIYRLAPGESVVIVDRDAITCAGAGCEVKRLPR